MLAACSDNEGFRALCGRGPRDGCGVTQPTGRRACCLREEGGRALCSLQPQVRARHGKGSSSEAELRHLQTGGLEAPVL